MINKNVILLAICQALLTTGNIMLVAVSGLIGQSLAPSDAQVTLPIAVQFVGLMLTTIPASLIMARIGRKRGFVLGNTIGIGGAMLCIQALQASNFQLFCGGTFMLGIGIGFGTLYRFAAIEVSPLEHKSRAISTIMAGGVLAALLGPNLAIYSQKWVPDHAFIGAFYGLTGLYILALIILFFIKIPPYKLEQDTAPSRPLWDVFRQPIFFVAALTATIAYVVMNLLMTATPLAMHHAGYHFEDAAWVIEWHVLGMFVPSFFTGRLIQKFGLLPVMKCGAVLMMLCAAINIQGTSFMHFAIALTLLGVGWNFLFIGATQLVTEAYRPSEKAKAQALNEFMVFSMVTLSALSAGWAEATFGWQNVNIFSLPVVAIALFMLIYFKRKQVDTPLSQAA